MPDVPQLGQKVRALRRREGLTQVDLATRLGVSASYLNLIESNKRPLPGALLLKLASVLRVELNAFAPDADEGLASDLTEAFGDPLLAHHAVGTPELRELANSSPGIARAVISLYRAFASARDASAELAGQISAVGGTGAAHGAVPSEEVSDLIQRRMNHFPQLETAAEALWRDAGLDGGDVYQNLVRYLAQRHGIDVRVVKVADERKAMRRYDPVRRVLAISEVLPPRSRRFQLAHQIGLLTQGEAFASILRDEDFTSDDARALARVALANYFAAAVMMPYGPFLEAAQAERYDIELLAHRFGASFEQVCHRLTSMRRHGHEGVPFHLIRIDVAGNISKRFSASGIRIARFSGACPRWNVHAAFLTPGMIRIQVSRMPDGGVYFCLARTLRSDRGGYNVPHIVQAIGMGCELRYAKELVYSDGIDLENEGAVVPVGVTCRMCEHLDCPQRAFPPLLHPLRIDENVRGLSFYSPVADVAKGGSLA
jgi:predicted transcriptional regulator/transcriptional regulator with XRE-family HTH domain